MFRALTVLTASLLFLPWQAFLWADTHERGDAGDGAIAPATALHAQVQRLQDALQRYRSLADAGGWLTVSDGPTIRPDAEDSRLAELAARLAVSGDLGNEDASNSTSGYNETLQDAVRLFQARHGLEVDGLVGRQTLRALNVPIERRIDQIRVNLDRMRRLSENQSDDFVLVNVAAFEAYLIRGGKKIWTTKVIVGEKDDETPEFRATLTNVVFNPTWTVPFSIASEEMLPKIKQDPDFFDKGGYLLFEPGGHEVDPNSVDWNAIDEGRFPFTLVQQPGPANQLGRIKFLFPNDYSICMHDTPAKELFNKVARAFSHGCIRVDAPEGFAEVLLGSEGWSKERIESQLESDKTRNVNLVQPLPVVISYWTAEVDDFGRLHFYNDIYLRDARVLRSLNRPAASDQS